MLHFLTLSKFLLKKFPKLLAVHIPTPAFLCILLPDPIAVIKPSNTVLIAGHEWEGGCGHGADVPACGPCFFVEVGETGADGFVGLESAGWSEEEQAGWGEGVVGGELQHPMIYATLIGAIEPIDTEMEVQQPFPCHYNMGDGLFVQAGLLFLET